MEESLFGTPSLIGEALVGQGLLTEQQLERLLTLQPTNKKRLGESAVSLGFMTDEQLARFLAEIYCLPYTQLDSDDSISNKAFACISEAVARQFHIFVLSHEDSKLTLAMADPSDIRAIDTVRRMTGCQVNKVVTSYGMIEKAIDRHYHASSRLAESMDNLLSVQTTYEDLIPHEASETGSEIDRLRHEASDAPVIQFVNLLLMQAVQERASDIHIEPEETCVSARFRIDSQLRETRAPSKSMLQGVSTRIKLLANLNIAERRLPQDGRFKFKVYDKTIDVRVSTLPTVHGEKIVMRILDRASLVLDMTKLGFEPAMLKIFLKVLHLPHGLVILTGPTGSGKTTTLYSALTTIADSTKNIVTIEDPVEYQIGKINQVNTKAEIGFTFAVGLRSILRQDPDIVMLGEIRDRETAEICIRAALTGHLVLTTLHTNDAVSAVSRLKDMGVEPYLLSATLAIIMSQRLVRRVCEACAEKWQPPAEVLDRLANLEAETSSWNFKRGRGCVRCGQTGYRGRVAVYEQFLISDKIKNKISAGASLDEIRDLAAKEGFKGLLQNAFIKVKDGSTTVDEAFSLCATQAELFE